MYPLPLQPPSVSPIPPPGSSQSTRLCSLCCIATFHQLPILHIIVYICWCYFLHFSHSLSLHCVQVIRKRKTNIKSKKMVLMNIFAGKKWRCKCREANALERRDVWLDIAIIYVKFSILFLVWTHAEFLCFGRRLKAYEKPLDHYWPIISHRTSTKTRK